VNNFTYHCKINDGTKVLLREFKFQEYKNLTKFLITNNTDDIEDAFNNVIELVCLQPNTFNFLEKIKILLTVRVLNIQSNVDLLLTCPETKKTFNVTLDLLPILNLLNTINVPNKCIQHENFTLHLNLPKKLFYSTEDFINKITINNEDFAPTHELLSALPAKIDNEIRHFIANIDNSITSKLLSVPSPHTGKYIEIPLSLMQNTLYDFIKLVFKRDLMSFYELEYVLNSKLNLDIDLIKNSTLAELNIYMNLFRKENEERRAAEKKANPNPAAITR